MKVSSYNREAAVAYAHKWALSSNPAYYHYGGIGGDCTNFVSQCVYTGTGIMNYTKDLGWYYTNANDKAPGWTGVEYFWNFMTGNKSIGPYGKQTTPWGLLPGDVVQLSFDGKKFSHSLFVVKTEAWQDTRRVFVAAHSAAADNRNLNTYAYEAVRYLHLEGART